MKLMILLIKQPTGVMCAVTILFACISLYFHVGKDCEAVKSNRISWSESAIFSIILHISAIVFKSICLGNMVPCNKNVWMCNYDTCSNIRFMSGCPSKNIFTSCCNIACLVILILFTFPSIQLSNEIKRWNEKQSNDTQLTIPSHTTNKTTKNKISSTSFTAILIQHQIKVQTLMEVERKSKKKCCYTQSVCCKWQKNLIF